MLASLSVLTSLPLIIAMAQASPAGVDLRRYTAEFDAGPLVALGDEEPPADKVSGRISFLIAAPTERTGLHVIERVRITDMQLTVGEISFVPAYSIAVFTLLDGMLAEVVVGGVAGGPHKLEPGTNDFKLVFSRGTRAAQRDELELDQFAVNVYDRPETSFVAGSGEGKISRAEESVEQ